MESDIKSTGIPYCILDCACFYDNLLSQAHEIKTKGEFYFPVKPDAQFAAIAVADVGEAAASKYIIIVVTIILRIIIVLFFPLTNLFYIPY